MALSWLQNNLNQKYAPKISLISTIRDNVAGYRKARDHNTVHASDVTKPDFCPRQLALLDITKKKKKDQYISTALGTTFDMGNVVSDLVREKWLGDAAHGFWECQRCGYVSPFGTKPNHACQGAPGLLKYVEATFLSQKYGISGSIDVLAALGAPKLFVTELKIMAPAEFDGLVMPLAEHRIRTDLYMELIEDDAGYLKERINLQQAKVLYVSRGYGKKNAEHNEIIPFKEYTVNRGDGDLKPIFEQATRIKLYKDTGTMPKGICATALDKNAKACTVCDSCFSGKYPAGKVISKEESCE